MSDQQINDATIIFRAIMDVPPERRLAAIAIALGAAIDMGQLRSTIPFHESRSILAKADSLKEKRRETT